jgi:hypothetical protein
MLRWIAYGIRWLFATREGRAALRVARRQVSGAETAERAVKQVAERVLTPAERLLASKGSLEEQLRLLRKRGLDTPETSGGIAELEARLQNVRSLLRLREVASA